MELSPAGFLFLLVVVGGIAIGIPSLAYRHGQKVGDQAGYIRGFKDGQQGK